MTKKILFLLSIAILCVAGLSMLITQQFSEHQSDSDKISSVKSATKSRESTETIPKTQLLPTALAPRNSYWRKAMHAAKLDDSIMNLLSDSNPESVMIAHHIKTSCISAGSYSDAATIGATYEQYLRTSNTGLSEEGIRKAIKLHDRHVVRCGRATDILFAIEEFRAQSKRARAQGGLLVSAPLAFRGDYENGLTADARDALHKVLKDPDLAPGWLTSNFYNFKENASIAGHFAGLSNDEAHGVTWLAICNYGAGCDDESVTRMMACYGSQFCAGNSVAEAISDSLGANRMPLIAERANQLGISVLNNGANFFKPRIKGAQK